MRILGFRIRTIPKSHDREPSTLIYFKRSEKAERNQSKINVPLPEIEVVVEEPSKSKIREGNGEISL